MSTHTIRLHRVLKAAPEKIYRAFLDADALAKWLPPFGFTCQVHSLDAKVGGTYRMTFTNFTTKDGLVNNSVFSVLEDRDGSLWFGTRGVGLSRYDGTSFATFSE